jgi:hypothetical protein
MITRRSFIASVGSAAAAADIMDNKASASSFENKASSKIPALGPAPKFPRSVMPPNPSSVRREIQEYVDRIMIMDTHEHLLSESWLIQDAQKHLDFTQLFLNYFPQDIIAAGMPEEEWEKLYTTKMSVDEKWEYIAPFLSKAKNTAYYWVLDLAIRS